MVELEEWLDSKLKSNLHAPLKNELSGGQRSRLHLAKILFTASEYARKSKVLILDEPDKGLPKETTVKIIKNITTWFKTRGILFLTVHTSEAQLLKFDQTITVTDGKIRVD